MNVSCCLDCSSLKLLPAPTASLYIIAFARYEEAVPTG